MKELLIIKTVEAGKIKSILTENQVDYQVVYNEIVQEKELSQSEFEKQVAKDYQDWANDPDEWKDARGE